MKNQKIIKNIQENAPVILGILFFAFISLLFWFSQSLKVYDAPGHLNLIWYIKEYLWPFFWGLNTSSLAGFDQGISYPPLFHFFAAALSFIFGIENAVKILVSLALIFTFPSIFYFTSVLSENKEKRFLLSCVLTQLVVVLPGYFGANLKALGEIGLLTSFISLPLVFFYLGSLGKLSEGKVFLPTLFLSGALLTHLVAGLFCLIIYSSVVLLSFYQSKKLPRSFLIHLLATLGLTSFFWVPFLLNYPNLSTSAHPNSLGWPNLISLLVSSGMFSYFAKKKLHIAAGLSLGAIIISFLVVTDNILLKTFNDHFIASKLYNLHLYRYQIYLYFLVTTLSIVFIFDNFKTKVNSIILKYFSCLLLLISLIYILARNPFPTTLNLEIVQNDSKGRFLEAFRRTEVYQYAYLVQTQLIQQNQMPWGYGLFTDATLNGPYLGSLIKSLRPEAYQNLDQGLIENKILPKEKVDEVLDLFAVENLISLEDDLSEKAIATFKTIEQEKEFELKVRSEQALVTIPKQQIVPVMSNWNQEVQEWWEKPGELEELLVFDKNKTFQKVNQDSISKVEVIDNNVNWTDFTFKVEGKESAPVLVKFGYSPNWKAFQGEEKLPIYKVSPNLMLVQAKGEVNFVYQRNSLPLLLLPLSFLSFFGLVIFRNKKFSA